MQCSCRIFRSLQIEIIVCSILLVLSLRASVYLFLVIYTYGYVHWDQKYSIVAIN